MNLVSTSSGIGRVDGEEIALLDLPYADLGRLMEERSDWPMAIAAATVASRIAVSASRLRPPIARPGKVWGIGLNYHAKARLSGRSIPKHPTLFLKAPSAIIGTGTVVPLPSDGPHEIDYEGEVAVVIGAHAACVAEKDALRVIAGVTAANDVTARDVHRITRNPSLAKSYDGFLPLGASLVTADEIVDWDDIALVTTVNGTIQQKATTSDLIFSIFALVAMLSRFSTLEPGDVILTGTPPGTGQDRGQALSPADEIVVRAATGLPLTNRVSLTSSAIRVDTRGAARGRRVGDRDPTPTTH